MKISHSLDSMCSLVLLWSILPLFSFKALRPLSGWKLEEVSALHQTQRLCAQSGVSAAHSLTQKITKKKKKEFLLLQLSLSAH